MAVNLSGLLGYRRIVFAHLSLLLALGVCALTARAYWEDLNCRDAALVEACKTALERSSGVRLDHTPKKIYIAAGLVPPNIKKDRTGREVDIITAALQIGRGRLIQSATPAEPIKNEQIQFIVEPFARHWFSYQSDRRFDAVATVPKSLILEGYRSDYYIMYRNGIGAMPSNNPVDIASLKDRRVVTFPGASRVIPELQSKEYFALFLEREDQRDHSKMLLSGQVDAVIADAMIFAYYNHELLKGRGPEPVFTDKFKPTSYTMVFRNAEYRDIFDDGLKKLAGLGKLKQIDDQYIHSSNLRPEIHYIGENGKLECEN